MWILLSCDASILDSIILALCDFVRVLSSASKRKVVVGLWPRVDSDPEWALRVAECFTQRPRMCQGSCERRFKPFLFKKERGFQKQSLA